MKRTLLVIPTAVSLGAVLVIAPPASADTENCATHGEYDQLEVLWSPGHVSEVFDIPGWISYVDDQEFRKSYRTCWDFDGTKIVVRYDINTGLSFDWFTRSL